MTRLNCAIAALLTTTLLPASLAAATASYTIQDGYSLPPNLSLTQFHPDQGTLHSITVDVHAWFGADYEIITFDDPVTIELDMTAGSGGFEPVGTFDFSTTIPPATNVLDYGAEQDSIAWIYSEGSASRTYKSGLTPFIGFGSIAMNAFLAPGDVSFSFLSGSGDIFDCHHCGTYGSRATVTYQYAAAPEPSMWSMMLGGFGLIGSVMRHRGKQAVKFASLRVRVLHD